MQVSTEAVDRAISASARRVLHGVENPNLFRVEIREYFDPYVWHDPTGVKIVLVIVNWQTFIDVESTIKINEG